MKQSDLILIASRIPIYSKQSSLTLKCLDELHFVNQFENIER